MTVILILGGTTEARTLASCLAEERDISPVVSLAGVTSSPEPQGVRTRFGGFGGPDGLATWLAQNRITAVIDATHPYAQNMQLNAAEACAKTSIPRVRLLRPPWAIRSTQTPVANLDEAAQRLPADATVLLTTGQKDIDPFVRRKDVSFVLRTIEHPGHLPEHIASMIARPPFSLEQELKTLTGMGATHLVTKNSGGAGTAKLDAAESLKVATIVIDRPRPPAGPIVETVDAAVAWLSQYVGFE